MLRPSSHIYNLLLGQRTTVEDKGGLRDQSLTNWQYLECELREADTFNARHAESMWRPDETHIKRKGDNFGHLDALTLQEECILPRTLHDQGTAFLSRAPSLSAFPWHRVFSVRCVHALQQ